MLAFNPAHFSVILMTKALSLGASLAGIVLVKTLLCAPSYQRRPIPQKLHQGGSALVLALHHPPDKLQMDGWDNRKGGTPGNRQLIKISRSLIHWLKKKYGIFSYGLTYKAGCDGTYLKDAAVLAGLGAIGRNNLLVTPQFGPKVRLRALYIDQVLQPTGPLNDFTPCSGCIEPCLSACPVEAFAEGAYQYSRCSKQISRDEAEKKIIPRPGMGLRPKIQITYCRLCELSCPVGATA
jgi:epoxyqueuosine reductase